jgi:hypothetical protein
MVAAGSDELPTAAHREERSFTMNDRTALAALARENQDLREQIASLAQTTALLADAVAQQLAGSMTTRDAVANLQTLNARAGSVMRKAS